MWYIDAVEEAICFGWIDSITKKGENGILIQRFSPRKENSSWTELNKQRARRMVKLGLMTKHGEKVLPNLDEEFKVDDDVLKRLKKDGEVWKNLKEFPSLYFKVRIDNIQRVRKNKELFNYRLEKLIETAKRKKLYGQWNDYGRLE